MHRYILREKGTRARMAMSLLFTCPDKAAIETALFPHYIMVSFNIHIYIYIYIYHLHIYRVMNKDGTQNNL